MEKIKFVDFRRRLSEFVGMARFANKRIAVTQHGKVVGGFVSPEALQLLDDLEMQSDIDAFDRAMKRYKRAGSRTLSHEEMVRRLDLDV